MLVPRHCLVAGGSGVLAARELRVRRGGPARRGSGVAAVAIDVGGVRRGSGEPGVEALVLPVVPVAVQGSAGLGRDRSRDRGRRCDPVLHDVAVVRGLVGGLLEVVGTVVAVDGGHGDVQVSVQVSVLDEFSDETMMSRFSVRLHSVS